MKAFVVERYGKDGFRAADVPEPERRSSSGCLLLVGTPLLERSLFRFGSTSVSWPYRVSGCVFSCSALGLAVWS
jgi:hypothetical protein